MKLKILAPAKINLYLEILKKKNDEPMHDVELVMQSVSLFDILKISCAKINSGDNEINLQVNSDLLKELPVEKNLAYIACREFLKSLNLTGYSVEIDIEKNIPINAGLAGGSTDAAAVLVGLSCFFGGRHNIVDVASNVGSDVPFCIRGGTCLATDKGTNLKKLRNIQNLKILICKPKFDVCTRKAYEAFDRKFLKVKYEKNDMTPILEAIESGNVFDLAKGIYNRFEEILEGEEKEKISYIKNTMEECGALGTAMSGSGSAVFGVFNSISKIKGCYKVLNQVYSETFICETVDFGCKVIDQS